jgi:hypothetical protein
MDVSEFLISTAREDQRRVYQNISNPSLYPDVIFPPIEENILSRPFNEFEMNIINEQAKERYRRYGLNANTPSFKTISFNEASDMLSNNKIERFEINPSRQSLSELPNKTVSLFGWDGTIYLVKARVIDNKLLPPI